MIERVRLPRIRAKEHEVQYFTDRYIHFSEEMIEQAVLGQAFSLSSRRISVWLSRIIHDRISHVTLLHFSRQLAAVVEQIRQAPLTLPVKALILDGVWFRWRGSGKRVLLVALGVAEDGRVYLLDWIVAKSEGHQGWLNLLQRLRLRGLDASPLIIGDGSLGLPSAAREVYPQSKLQLCLWHLCQDMFRQVKGLSWSQRQRLEKEFWEVFNAPTLEACYARYLQFVGYWGCKQVTLANLFARYEDYLFHFFDFPAEYRQRLRTINLAESFFSRLREILRKYPGLSHEEQIDALMGLLWKGVNAYRDVYKTNQTQRWKGTFIYAW